MALLVGGIFFRGTHYFLTTVAFRQETLNCRYNRHWRYHGGFRHALQHSSGQESCLDPWTKATVDYSAANEYVEVHYGNHPLLQSSSSMKSSIPYFLRETFGGDKVREPIYNARELRTLSTQTVSNNSTKIASPCHSNLLKKYGMTLVDSPAKMVDVDCKNRKQIEEVYVQELEDILPTPFSSETEMYCFWHPMLRGTTTGYRHHGSKVTTA